MANTKRIRLWVNALRSRRYKQGYGNLKYKAGKQGIRYCCLGVACDVFRRTTGRGKWARCCVDYGGADVELKTWLFSGAGTFLPTQVMTWYGLDADPLLDLDLALGATYYNDAYRETFAQIADRIEDLYLVQKPCDSAVITTRARGAKR